MSLAPLIRRARLTVLGLNSGTSADGLDLAVVQIGGVREKVRLIGGRMQRFPRRLHEMIRRTADSPAVELEQLVRLDNYLGQFIGEAAAGFMQTLSPQGIAIDLIGSHGQTVRHVPAPVRLGRSAVRGTLQAGSLDQIAAATGCVTVGDFRQADIAVGGEGAPITTGAMHRLFATPRKSRLIVNIGGMANYFYFPAADSRRDMAARDCGPGNSLTDTLMMRLFGRTFDRGGRTAARGEIDQPLLETLAGTLGFSSRAKSTGRELFGAALADEMIRQGQQRRLSPENLITTAAELTVLGIVRAVGPLIRRDPQVRTLYLMGGGRHNRHFQRRLAEHFTGYEVQAVDNLGIDGDLVEAAAYAVMAAACVRSTPLPLAKALDRRRPIPGRIAQPPLV